ncbi:MSHA biogenesis protein MshK [Vibrio ostreicida]|uniref:MSHA biogenesis protein MshK n=1 Tax=Vibrio ostreicida TaxID=526588 RepID=A0ABT8BN27_9VIBR|nr:MSHA biogenesis protein MshK [Vibrio ostreicida]MDN3608298.1 MSHA biogenesis protein MshK [Vibrio ostreicida]NPD09718.1 MSHA biogenesis protein MshK [Vibrio ostreicida]
MVRLLFIVLMGLSFSALATQDQDPTAPLGWKNPEDSKPKNTVPQEPVPVLHSIVCTVGEQCRVVLNSEVAQVGERVAGYKVDEINQDAVTLSRAGKQWTLALFSADLKQ